MRTGVAVVCLAIALPAGSVAAAQAAPAPAPTSVATCRIDALHGLSALYTRTLRQVSADDGGRTGAQPNDPGHLEDFWRVAAGVLGLPEDRPIAPFDRLLVAGVGSPTLGDFPCDENVRTRDNLAWSMSLVGYSAHEIADVVGGHLTRTDLDAALARLMAGQPRAGVAAFIDARWVEPGPPQAVVARALSDLTFGTRALAPELETALVDFAQRDGVPANLVRAVIAAESGGNARAESPAGAIGLMQLMPLTAAALRVDPWQPLQNLQGGIAYLATLLRAYEGNTTLALIAYNAGPEHADRVRDGRAVASRETRRYLDAVAARYPLQ